MEQKEYSSLYKGVFKAASVNDSTRVDKSFIRGFFGMLCVILLLGCHPIIGSSMEPTYHHGQYTLCFRALLPLRHGQVVVADTGENKLIIKRVIGIPGDIISIHSDGTVYVNGSVSDYGVGDATVGISYDQFTEDEDGNKSITLGKHEYFLMGDNHENSKDSRHWGPFKRSRIMEIVALVG